MTRVLLSLVPLLTALSCYSAGGDGDGDSDGTGARGGTTGLRGGSGGSGGELCGPCPGAACQQAVNLVIAADPSVAPANLSRVQVIPVDGTGISFNCFAYSDCTVNCSSVEYQVPDGHHTLNISAPGFEGMLLEFDIVNPTNCGCCGCCPGSFYQQLTLIPIDSVFETCCADLNVDALNCGACGVACEVGTACIEGLCQPSR